jgi:tetratricopeptide (TPR) repeat protein
VAGATRSRLEHHCLLSNHHLRSRTASGLQKSIHHARLAVEAAPDSAAGHAALALALAVTSSYGVQPPSSLMLEARLAAERALELNVNQVEAHCALGLVELMFDWNWAAASNRLEAALALAPGNASAHHWLGLQRLVMQDVEGALHQIVAAYETDPLSPMVGAQHGWFLYLLRRYSEAIEVLRATLELDPLFFRTHVTMAWCYLELGDIEKAESAVRQAAVFNRYPSLIAMLAECKAVKGESRAALREARALRSSPTYVSPYWLARVYARLQDRTQALRLLAMSVEAREWFVILLGLDPAFDVLRCDPSFAALLELIGLPSGSKRQDIA